MFAYRFRTLAIVGALALAGCQREEAPAEVDARPVRTIVVQERLAGESVSLAGTIESQVQADLGFRIGGRLIERLVNVGDVVEAGQLLARLDPTDEENGMRAAEASLVAAEGQMNELRTTYERQRTLYDRDIVARAALDRAETAYNTSVAQVDVARAQYSIARRRLADTELYADAPGTVTARGAETGEVVTPGRMIYQIARNEGRDAVFDVPARIMEMGDMSTIVDVALSQNLTVAAQGRIREVAPRADAATGTFRVRVGLIDPPAELRLGSTVLGRAKFGEVSAIEVPASALTSSDGAPAVWIVDTASSSVSLRPVAVDRFTPGYVVVADGLAPGDVVVTAGVQALRPGQKVRLGGSAS